MTGRLPRAAIPVMKARGATYVRQDIVWGLMSRLDDIANALPSDYHVGAINTLEAAQGHARFALKMFDAEGGNREPPD